MKTNIIPSIIIAAALLTLGFLFKQSSGNQVQSIFDQLEQSVQKKDAEGKTQISRIASGFSKSAADGFSQGFQEGQNKEELEKLNFRDKLSVSEVKIIPGRMKTDEKIIGIVKNESTAILGNISLNLVCRDAEGALLDVSSRFVQVDKTLKPGDEVGFEIERALGKFEESEEMLSNNRSSTAIVTISDFKIVR